MGGWVSQIMFGVLGFASFPVDQINANRTGSSEYVSETEILLSLVAVVLPQTIWFPGESVFIKYRRRDTINKEMECMNHRKLQLHTR